MIFDVQYSKRNIMFVWYTRKLIKFLNLTSDDTQVVLADLEEYSEHLESVYSKTRSSSLSSSTSTNSSTSELNYSSDENNENDIEIIAPNIPSILGIFLL